MLRNSEGRRSRVRAPAISAMIPNSGRRSRRDQARKSKASRYLVQPGTIALRHRRTASLLQARDCRDSKQNDL
jgi:hypothetical protein